MAQSITRVSIPSSEEPLYASLHHDPPALSEAVRVVEKAPYDARPAGTAGRTEDPSFGEALTRLRLLTEQLQGHLAEVSRRDSLGAVLAKLDGLAARLTAYIYDAQPVAPTFSVTGQIRQRSEADDKRTAADSPQFHLLRTRVNVSFQPDTDMDVVVQVQNSRLWGRQDPAKGRGTLDGSAQSIDFHQAYFAVDNLFDIPLKLKVGRQEMVYGNQRLSGSVRWSNIGRTFNAGVASYHTGRVKVDLFTAKLVEGPTRSTSQNLHSLYGTFKASDAHKVDAFALLDNNTEKLPRGEDVGKSKLTRYTVGTYLHGKLKPFDYELEATVQRGRTDVSDSTPRASIEASSLSGAFGYTLPRGVRIGALHTRLSGDKTPGDGTARTFNTLFATNHKFYGFMDYFPKTRSANGLQDMALTLSMKATKAVNLGLDLHHFALDHSASWTDATGRTRQRQALGQELDVTTKFKYNQHFTLGAGASFFFVEVFSTSTHTVERLGASSSEIGEIFSVIDDIADQTNLLALNAAIEAARAGDQGRGFAVVADEVRKLAERTTQATKQIADMIGAIQTETQQAVEARRHGNEEVTEGISLADQAGTSLEEIVTQTQGVVDMVSQIASANEEQSTTSEEISRNVEAISTVSEESARGLAEIAHSTESLNTLTEKLHGFVLQFRMDREVAQVADRAPQARASARVDAQGRLDSNSAG